MFSSLWLKSTLTLLLIALIVMGSCKMMKMMGCGKRPPRPPRPAKIESFDVVSIPTGNSIVVKAGRRDRTITITLKGIGVPDLPGAAEAARTALEKLAGSTIKVELPRRRLRGEESTGKTTDQSTGRWIVCPECGGTGKTTIDSRFMAMADMANWMNFHRRRCPRCDKAVVERRNSLCKEANAKWVELKEKHKDFQPFEQVCMCGGSGKLYEERPGVLRNEEPLPEARSDTEWAEWMNVHKKTCDRCCRAMDKCDGAMCEEAFAKFQEVLRKGCVEVDCEKCSGTGRIDGRYCLICSGDGKLWRRPPEARVQAIVDDPKPPEARSDFTTPQAWGETGLLLQLELLKGGFVISVGEIPKNWKKAENQARKLRIGIWSKPR